MGRYFPIQHVVKKDGSFVIIGERKKQKPLYQSHCIEGIATKPVQSDIVFSQSNPFLSVSCENLNNLVCLCLQFVIAPTPQALFGTQTTGNIFGINEKNYCIIALLHYSAALQYCLVNYVVAQIFCFSGVLINSAGCSGMHL